MLRHLRSMAAVFALAESRYLEIGVYCTAWSAWSLLWRVVQPVSELSTPPLGEEVSAFLVSYEL